VFDLLSGPNVTRLVRLFQEIGGKELKAIVRFGGVFGFIIGTFQALSYSIFDQWWLMPIVGGVVGLGTNWMALQMIFRPIEPKRYAGVVTYQGMFPRRQAEIAEDYGRITAREILTPPTCCAWSPRATPARASPGSCSPGSASASTPPGRWSRCSPGPRSPTSSWRR
jgi:uncharacterized membrane protein YheB (UPF0754 family)